MLVSKDTTPFPSAPLYVGGSIYSSDKDGKFTAYVPESEDASISSGLRAIKIEQINGEIREILTGTGASIAAIANARGGVISVEISSRISVAPICKALNQTSGEEMLWFRYTNRFGEPLEVADASLNTILSPQGTPYPIASFESTDESKPDFFLGFEWNINYFKDFDQIRGQDVVRATWRLLGAEVSVDQPQDEVPFCTAEGEFSGCTRLSESMTTRLYEQAFSTVTRLSSESDKAKKRGLWKPSGKFRNPYFKQAATSLRTIRQLISQLPGNGYVCEGSVPQGCRYVEYPKAQLLAQFEEMLKVKLPPGLKPILKLYPAERRKFLAELSKLPTKYLTCGR